MKTPRLPLSLPPAHWIALFTALASLRAGETLHNGITLPDEWPPRAPVTTPGGEPMPVPYLAKPPAVIPIDVGRQLFVDDFLIEQTTMKRTHHLATEYEGNPVLRADTDADREGKSPMAMPFSDGVWFDPQDQLFKMWYLAGYARQTAYATSRDGLKWEKPALDVRAGTNVVQPGARDSSTVWLDLEEHDPQRRFKMWRAHSEDKRFGVSLHFSADGIHWSDRALRTQLIGDRTTVFWNPFRKVWVYSIRHGWSGPRARRYWEVRDLLAGPYWNELTDAVMWTGSDKLDPPREDLKDTPQLYNLDAVAYESVMVGLFTVWRGDKNLPPGRPKPNSIFLGYSRDGYHWDRPDRRPFIPVSERQGDWNWGNVQSVGGCFLVHGDRLWFYHSGRAGSGPTNRDGNGGTGVAFLRRDGFASMNAIDEATLTTRAVRFSGHHLFVNVDAPAGELRAEVLDAEGKVIAPFTQENCAAVSADTTLTEVKWRGAADLSKLAGQPVKFRFTLRNGALYSFWVSPDASGASHGYVAAGGPGFTGPTDTNGSGAGTKAK
jgi:hypothetical protein